MKIYKNKANILAFFQMRSHRLHMESLISNLIFLKRSEDFWSFLPKLRSYIPQRFLQTIHTVQEAGIQLWSASDKERPMSQESLQVPQNFHTFWRFSYSSSILLISGSHLTYSKMPENWLRSSRLHTIRKRSERNYESTSASSPFRPALIINVSFTSLS